MADERDDADRGPAQALHRDHDADVSTGARRAVSRQPSGGRWAQPWGRGASRLAALFVWVAVSALAGGARAQGRPPGYEEAAFTLSAPPLPTTDLVVLVDSAGRVRVPLSLVLEALGIPVAARGDSLVLEWPPPSYRTVLVRGARRLLRPPRDTVWPPDTWLDVQGEIYLSPDALAQVLDGAVQVDLAVLQVNVATRAVVPAVRRQQIEAERQRARALAEREEELNPADLPYRSQTGGLSANWGVSVVQSQLRGPPRLAGTVLTGTALWGGSLELGNGLSVGSVFGSERFVVRYLRAFPRSAWLQRLQLGTVFSEGAVVHQLLGAVVSNDPFLPRRRFDQVVLTPPIPAGWEYELYQGDRLVAVGRAGDQPAIPAPINYGSTDLRLRLVGPAGQERIERLSFFVPVDQVPSGEARYRLGGGRCWDDACRAYGYGELRYGWRPALTVGGGGDVTRTDTTTRWRPYGLLGWNLRPSVRMELQGNGVDFVRGAFQAIGLDQRAVRIGYLWDRPGEGAVGRGGWRADASASGRLLGARWLSLQAQAEGQRRHRVDTWQLQAATAFERTTWTATLERPALGAEVQAALRAARFLPPSSSFGLRNVSVEATVGGSRQGLLFVDGFVQLQPRPTSQLRIGLRWARALPAPTFSLFYVLRRPTVFLQGLAVVGPSGPSALAAASGSVAFLPTIGGPPGAFHRRGVDSAGAPATGRGYLRRGLTLYPYESVGQGGVWGVVYYDTNANGRRDPGEPQVVGVGVRVNDQRVETDGYGVYTFWPLPAYQATSVALDTLSLDDPAWTTPEPVRRIRPNPNAFLRVDLPLIRTREVVGRVIPDEPTLRAGGLTVELQTPDGTVVARTRTFSDGAYYFERVRPGVYLLALAASSLEVIGARADPPRLPLTVVAADDPLAAPPLRLRRR